MYLSGCEAVGEVAADFRETFPQCREISYARCRHIYLHQRIGRALLRVFSPLMGLEGLRRAKESYQPALVLTKYVADYVGEL